MNPIQQLHQSLSQLVDWMREHTGKADGTHDMLVTAYKRTKEINPDPFSQDTKSWLVMEAKIRKRQLEKKLRDYQFEHSNKRVEAEFTQQIKECDIIIDWYETSPASH